MRNKLSLNFEILNDFFLQIAKIPHYILYYIIAHTEIWNMSNHLFYFLYIEIHFKGR